MAIMAFTMIEKTHVKEAFQAAVPIMLGYVAIGIPCGILCDSIGAVLLGRWPIHDSEYVSGGVAFGIYYCERFFG